MNYLQLFELLASDNSRLFKEKTLAEYKNDDVLKRIFFMGLNPFINFWIRKIPEYQRSEFSGSDTDMEINDCLDVLMTLSEREVTGHAAIERLRNLLVTCKWQYDAKVIEKIIAKDFKCGVSTSTVNKIWPDLIPEYPVQLAEKMSAKVIAKMQWPAAVQLKYDGMRFNAVCHDGKIDFYTRNGNPLELLGNLTNDFSEVSEVVVDGELWVDDGTGKPLPRKIGNGVLTKAIRGTISATEASRIKCSVWDVIPYSDWIKGKCKILYKERLANLDDLNLDISNKIHIVETHIVNNLEEANVIFNELLSSGEEGILLKNMNEIWENKRVHHQVKFKAERSADLYCYGVEMGTPGSKYDGLIGALLLCTSDDLINVKCGTGLKDEDRKKDSSEFVGKIIETGYNERIKSAGDKKESLFLPVYKYVRLDKNIANASHELA